MPEHVDTLTIGLRLDASQFRRELEDARRHGERFGASLTRAFASAAIDGRRLSDVLRAVLASLSRHTLAVAFRPLERGLGSLFETALGGAMANARGNAFAGGRPLPFASGGIVSSPTLFALGGSRRAGMMGEAGPEAVLPLRRGADGRLGVSAEIAGPPVQVTVNIATPDVDGFRQARGQIMGELARAVARGHRNL